MLETSSQKLPLPNGPHTLCFNKEDFMKEDFNVEHFVVECRRKVALEILRNDLHVYLKILQSAMIELINKDYADFVNLSTNLVGMDKAINNLLNPLSHLKQDIVSVRNTLAEAANAVEEKIKQQKRIREKKECLKMLMSIIQSVEKMESLLGVQSSSQSSSPPQRRELNGQLVERVATEFNKLQFYVSKCRGLPLVEEIKPRIGTITVMLQYSLEGSFKEGLATGSADILRECLRTYATIDKMRDAENLFRTVVVKSYMEETINEQFIRSHPRGLSAMYDAVLDFFPRHFSKLREVTTSAASTSRSVNDTVSGYDFVVNAIWPEVVSNIEARTSSIFAPGNPNVFHEKYSLSLEFVENFECQCGSQASVKRLRAHPSYNTFMTKWSLPVYFQIRFQEIAGGIETALFTTPFARSEDGISVFHLQSTQVLWSLLLRCWASDVYLAALCHRFWKLSLQLISRYSVWMAEVRDQVNEMTTSANASQGMTKSDSSSSLHSMSKSLNGGLHTDSASLPSSVSAAVLSTSGGSQGSTGGMNPTINVSDIVSLTTDAETLAGKIPEFFTTVVSPRLVQIGSDNTNLLKDSLQDSVASLRVVLPQFAAYITTEISSQCFVHLKAVNDIPRLYRRTNREMPTKPSTYVSEIVKPVHDFIHQHKSLLSETNRLEWLKIMLQSVGEQFLTVTTDNLTAVRKMEESLKRLKAARGAGSTASGATTQGASDDDKIRQQLALDVKEFGRQIVSTGLKEEDIEVYAKLRDVVASAINGTLA